MPRIKLLIMMAALLPGVAWAERWLDLEDCVLTTPGTPLTGQAKCGQLTVPENPADPDGRQLRLKYAVAPARSAKPEPDPVVFLAGGPGQAATEAWPIVRHALRRINGKRDVILLDQRGTGNSNKLDCDFPDMDPLVEPDLEEMEAAIRACKADWDADVRFYTTADGADDLELLRRHLEVEQFNLIGGSYGTRMAQVYLRRYPDAVRTVILDGVVPTRLVLGAEHADKLDEQLGKLFAACAADTDCDAHFPRLENAFEELKARYREHSEDIQIVHPRTGELETLRFDHNTLGLALRFLAYSPASQVQIPYLIHEAATTGDVERLASQAMITTGELDEMIAFGLNLTVGCSEDWPHWPDGLDQSHTLMGNAMSEMFARICGWWPAGDVDSDFHEPFDSDVPMLILSGELDPVTPPEYGDEAAAQYANSLHLVSVGQGHIALRPGCMDGVAAQFIAEASVEDLDAGCLDRLGAEPFFLNLLGPAP